MTKKQPGREKSFVIRASHFIIFLVIGHCPFFLLPACSTGSASAHVGERYMVKTQSTPFYKNGPAQATGPDFTLKKDQRVTMLSQQFGFSHVATDDGQSGYVPTEDLAPAPPEPKPSPTAASAAFAEDRKGRASSRRPTAREESQVPLPEFPEAKPPPDAPGFRY